MKNKITKKAVKIIHKENLRFVVPIVPLDEIGISENKTSGGMPTGMFSQPMAHQTL